MLAHGAAELASPSRIAILCSGVGIANRGFERFSSELADQLSAHRDVTLLASGRSASPTAVRLPSWHRDWPSVPDTVMPRTRWWTSAHERSVFIELSTFSLAAAWWLVRHGAGLVVCAEPLVARRLTQLRSRLGGRWRTIFVDGLGLTPNHLAQAADQIQVMSPDRADEARQAGIEEGRIIQLPYGVDTSKYKTAGVTATDARRRLGLADGPVVLSVAALNRGHKRVDRIVSEFAQSRCEGSLVLCGPIEDLTILDEAKALLGPRVHHLCLAPEEMTLVYAAADCFVVGALEEGFCLAAVEAMASGLPVIAADTPHFRWLLGPAGHLVEMGAPGALARALDDLPQGDPDVARRQANRFSWEALIGQYIEMVGVVG
jgi:glycosyltransferase involved in cell wall biosynthesis